MRSKPFVENVIKNAAVLVALSLLWPAVQSYMKNLQTNDIGYQTIIVLSSLLIMSFLFCAYTFTYKDSDVRNSKKRLADHMLTGITIFGCGGLLEISYSAINIQLGSTFGLMGFLMVLFYISLVLFDFWDLARGLQ